MPPIPDMRNLKPCYVAREPSLALCLTRKHCGYWFRDHYQNDAGEIFCPMRTADWPNDYESEVSDVGQG